MAKKKSNHYPVVRRAALGGATQTTQNRILFADRELSKLNHRLYRSTRYYQCKIDMDATETGTYAVYALRDDWMLQKAVGMAYQNYLNNTQDERDNMSDVQIARWEDFRIAPGISGDQLLSSLTDDTLAPQLMGVGSFPLSKVTDAAGTQRTFTFAPAPGAGEYSVLIEYGKAADTQNSPSSLTSPGPYEDVDANTDALTYANLEADGAAPPYNGGTSLPSTPWVKVAELAVGASGAQRLSTGFFTAPCGMIAIEGPTSNWSATNLTLEVKAGDYKGVHAPSMFDIATINRKRKVVK